MKRLGLAGVVLTMAFLTLVAIALANDRGGSVLEKARPSSGCPNTMITLTGKKLGKPGTGAAWFTARVIPFGWLEEAKITSETSATTRVPFFLALTGADEKGRVSLERPPLGKRSNQVPFTLTSLVTCFKAPERKESQEAPESKEAEDAERSRRRTSGPRRACDRQVQAVTAETDDRPCRASRNTRGEATRSPGPRPVRWGRSQTGAGKDDPVAEVAA